MERSFSLADAESHVLRAIHSLGLRPVLEDKNSGASFTAWHCELVNGEGVSPAGTSGAGKGNHDEARVGALFEALEHLISGPDYCDAEQIYLQSVSHIASNELAADPSTAILSNAPDHKLACHRYTSLTSHQRLDVPLYLSAPWYVADSGQPLRDLVGDCFDYRKVARYTVNSGCAIGMTENEATLHALNEVIERDAFSLLLTQSFLGSPQPPRIVDPRSLPTQLAELHCYVESRLNCRIYLLDITTEVGVPVYLAYVPPTADTPHLRGAGASLSPSHAAYRALNELLQCYIFKDNRYSQETPFAHLEPLRKYPALYRCGRFDITELLPSAHIVPFLNQAVPREPEPHIEELTKKITAAGFPIYRRTIQSLPNGITAVHALIPGMERFMLVTDGYVVTPGYRGLQATS